MTSLIKTINEIKNVLAKAERPIGFVPTMGALHAGHESLISIARNECKTVVISDFVNPLQFGPEEDYEKYPRDLDNDLGICRANSVDYVFAPDEKEIYPNSGKTEIIAPPRDLTGMLCGKTRKGHFSGVVTVIKRLLEIAESDYVYFGEKDLQQIYVIRWLVNEYKIHTFVRSCPIIREKNGLACSSRNKLLTEEQIKIAVNIYKSLLLTKQNVRSGIFTAHKAILESLIFLSKFPEIKVEYFEARAKNNLVEVNEHKIKDFYFLIAAKIGSVRLIDNIEV